MRPSAASHAQQVARRRAMCCFLVGGLLILISLWRYQASQQLGGYGAYVKITLAPKIDSQGGAGGAAPLQANDLKAILTNLQQQLDALRDPVNRLHEKVSRMAYSAPLTTGSASKDLVRGVDHTGEETIFVNIASFRDEECPPTLRDMFLKARAPWRVFVGVLQQNDEKDPRCWPAEWANCSKHTFCPSDQVRIRHIAPNEAKGPTYGRYLADAMYRGEKYYFLMDSHNRFVTHWDDIIIRVYRKAPSAKAVLSHYPEALLLEEKDSKPLDGRDTTTFMCGAKFIADGYLRFDGAVVHKTEIPRLQPFSAAGMLFADAQMMKEVPFDPHLPFLFDGEEFLYTVRMWTHGWDIYAPSENIMYHFYYRAKSAKVWSEPNNNWYHWQRRSVERVQYMLGSTHANTTNRIVPLNTTNDYILVELDRYGLGTERSIEDYYKFSGVDPVHRTVPNWCTRA